MSIYSREQDFSFFLIFNGRLILHRFHFLSSRIFSTVDPFLFYYEASSFSF
jgi:hypothetical protein